MPQHGYSKLTEGGDNAFETDGSDLGGRCVDRRCLSRCRLLTFALAVSTTLLALALVGIAILMIRIPSAGSLPPEFRSTGLGRDSRYMTRNHSADGLWNVYLEDHLGEYSTPEGSFDRGEFSM
jgi:hypothetical protein